MRRRSSSTGVTILRVLAPVCLVASVLPVAASATTPGPGTFTTITTPKKDVVYQEKVGPANHLKVAGHTSSDVTSVDIECVTAIYNNPAQAAVLATSVPVTNGSFSANTTLPSNLSVTCRLRAIPTGTSVSDGGYFSSYTGPLLYAEAFAPMKDAGTTYGFTAIANKRDGVAFVTDAGNCGAEAVVPIDPAGPQAGPISLTCGAALPSSNITAGSPTASAIQVGGRNAYLPAAVHSFRSAATGALTVAQSALTVAEKTATDGAVTITESAPLMRCSAANTYPPTTTSCPHLVSTGVRFARVTTIVATGEQVAARDTFTSTDHKAHTLKLQYFVAAEVDTGNGDETGKVGYVFPGHGHVFKAEKANQVITGLGTKPATTLIRSDLYATSDDPAVDTTGVTYSRAPSSIRFAGIEPNEFGMLYALKVPAAGRVSLGFATSARLSTAATARLGATAGLDMLPTVTRAGFGSSSSGQAKASGEVVAGANGLPVGVTVNGHAAKVTVTSATTEHFSVRFHLPSSTHRIKTVLTDPAGNKVTTSAKV